MEEKQTAPISLKIVAALFIITGISTVIEMLISLIYGTIVIFNFNLLGLFIGPGLLSFKNGWRICALVVIWIGFIAAPVLGVLFITQTVPAYIRVFGQIVGEAPVEFALPIIVVIFALYLWEYRVLTCNEVRRLFYVKN